jgi:predicted MFS family arabinose efflux permease
LHTTLWILNHIQSFYILIIIIFTLRIIHGACSAIIGVLVYSLTISLTDDSELELALGILEIGWSICTSSGPIFAAFFFEFGGYSLPFIFLGSILFISVFLSYQINSNRLNEHHEDEQNASFIGYLKYPNIFLILLGFIVVMIISSYYYPCLMNHLKEKYSLSTSISSLFFVIPMVSYIFILQFLNYLTKTFGIYVVYSFGLIISSISCLFLYPCPPIPKSIGFIVFGFLLNGFGQSPVFIPGLVALSQNVRKHDPNIDELIANDIASTVNTLTINIGEFIGPIIGGYYTSKYDFKYCCYIIFLLGIIYSAIFILCFINAIKDELKYLFISKDNMVQILRDEFNEKLIDSQIMSNSLSFHDEQNWNFKFEVLSSRRNYHVKRRKSLSYQRLYSTFSN